MSVIKLCAMSSRVGCELSLRAHELYSQRNEALCRANDPNCMFREMISIGYPKSSRSDAIASIPSSSPTLVMWSSTVIVPAKMLHSFPFVFSPHATLIQYKLQSALRTLVYVREQNAELRPSALLFGHSFLPQTVFVAGRVGLSHSNSSNTPSIAAPSIPFAGASQVSLEVEAPSLDRSLALIHHPFHQQCLVEGQDSLVTAVVEQTCHHKSVEVVRRLLQWDRAEMETEELIILAYLLLSAEASLRRIWIIHVLSAEHLSWLPIALTWVLLSIACHVRRIHSWSTPPVLLVWWCHTAVLQLGVVRRCHGLLLRRLSLLRLCRLGGSSRLGTSAGVGSFG